MRTELEDIYDRLFVDYIFENINRPRIRTATDLEYSIIEIISRELQRAEDSFIDEVKLRSDAKLFTLIIFHQMVAIPLLIELEPENIKNIQGYIRDDVKDLIGYAREEKEGSEMREITAHTVLSLIDENWNTLNISREKWWND